MSPGLAPAGGLGRPGPSAPTHRPRWLLFLSSIALLYGGLMLVSGLTALSDPATATRLPVTRPLAPEEESMVRELTAATGEIVARHSVAIRTNAAASVLVALLMLYSAAAALSRDRHGRTAMLVAAWLGIAYQVGTLPLVLPMTNDFAAARAPLLLRMWSSTLSSTTPGGSAIDTATARVTADGGASAGKPATDDASRPPTSEEMVSLAQAVVLRLLLATALLGVLGSLLLIVYFGGRRGRALYGLPPRR